jgi:integrase/recombinase XerD
MFDRLFKRPHVVVRHQNGPLARERLRYLAFQAEQQMCPLTLQGMAGYILIVARSLRLADRPRELITEHEIEVEAERWANRQPKWHRTRLFHYARRNFKGHAVRWLRFLGRLQLPANVQRPYAKQVGQFTDHLLRERGASPQTVEYCSGTIHRFLAQVEEAGFRLKTLTIAQVDELLAKQVGAAVYARSTIRSRVWVLRTFFRFAERPGWCRKGLAAAIMTPLVFPQAGLSVGPSWDDVKRLLAGAEGRQPVDVRDYALLMLLAVYGLRAGEVTALRLKDFDWEREILTVPHSKSQRPRTYPLCRPVGDAVLRYLREIRPQSDRQEVFLYVRAPFRPLTADGLGGVVRHRLQALGVSLPHYGPHVLRHACATHLLSQGFTLKEIGNHLGHRSPDATSIYAKVDLGALRAVGDFDLEDLL